MSTCRSCDAPVLWVLTETGKRMPLDLEPDPDGLFVVEHGVAYAVGLFSDGPRYTSHFATCPDADDWRKSHPPAGPPRAPDDPSVRIPIGHEHPSTSRDMSAAMGLASAGERADCLDYIGHRERGATAAECADSLGRSSRNQIAVSFLLLRRDGWIERVLASEWQHPLEPGEDVDKEGYLRRPTGPRTRGIVHRICPDMLLPYERWRRDRG